MTSCQILVDHTTLVASPNDGPRFAARWARSANDVVGAIDECMARRAHPSTAAAPADGVATFGLRCHGLGVAVVTDGSNSERETDRDRDGEREEHRERE